MCLRAACLHGNCLLAFLCYHVFPVVSELDYLLLEHVVFLDDLDFYLWEMLRQGGPQHILGCFDID